MWFFLQKYKHGLGVLLLCGLIANAVMRFNGSWKRFSSMMLVQILFSQAVYGYLRGGWVGIGPGGLGKNANPVSRACLAGFAFVAYVVVFFLDFY